VAICGRQLLRSKLQIRYPIKLRTKFLTPTHSYAKINLTYLAKSETQPGSVCPGGHSAAAPNAASAFSVVRSLPMPFLTFKFPTFNFPHPLIIQNPALNPLRIPSRSPHHPSSIHGQCCSIPTRSPFNPPPTPIKSLQNQRHFDEHKYVSGAKADVCARRPDASAYFARYPPLRDTLLRRACVKYVTVSPN
jgi:hypothetical protein